MTTKFEIETGLDNDERFEAWNEDGCIRYDNRNILESMVAILNLFEADSVVNNEDHGSLRLAEIFRNLKTDTFDTREYDDIYCQFSDDTCPDCDGAMVWRAGLGHRCERPSLDCDDWEFRNVQEETAESLGYCLECKGTGLDWGWNQLFPRRDPWIGICQQCDGKGRQA